MNQQERIIELCKDGNWVCQSSFHPISWSPHKRRAELAEKYKHPDGTKKYEWEERKCEHGITASKDYRLLTTRWYPVAKFAPKEPDLSTQPSLFSPNKVGTIYQ